MKAKIVAKLMKAGFSFDKACKAADETIRIARAEIFQGKEVSKIYVALNETESVEFNFRAKNLVVA